MKTKDKIRGFIASVIAWRYFPPFILLMFFFVLGFSIVYFSDPQRINSWVMIFLVVVIIFIVVSIIAFVAFDKPRNANSPQAGIRLDYRGPHSSTTKLYLDYKRPLTIKDFHITIIPLLESLEKMNDGVGALITPREVDNLYIRQLHYASPLQIDIGGFIPQTIEVLRQVFKDKEFRNIHEKKMAELELAKTQLELTRLRLENEERMLDNTRKIIDLVFPNATEEQKIKIVETTSPRIRDILEKNRELMISQSLITTSSREGIK